jgi:hypothetical protein
VLDAQKDEAMTFNTMHLFFIFHGLTTVVKVQRAVKSAAPLSV